MSIFEGLRNGVFAKEQNFSSQTTTIQFLSKYSTSQAFIYWYLFSILAYSKQNIRISWMLNTISLLKAALMYNINTVT